GSGAILSIGAIYLTELNNPSSVSDILTYVITPNLSFATINGQFNSDSDSGPALTPPPNGIGFVEDGVITFTDPLYGVQFVINSDVEPVPEPGTLTLLGIGIVGLASYGWRWRMVPRY